MTCKVCNSRNPISNKFCRECGAKIVIPEGTLAAEEAARAEAERKAERGAILLADAHLLAEKGKYIGAIPIAEEAVVTLPFSASAYTLLVDLYEHTDQRNKAIVAQEKVVELLPNALHEQHRLERMKKGERTSAPPGRAYDGNNVPTLRGAGMPTTTGLSLPSWFPIATAAIGGGFALFIGYLAMTPGNSLHSKHTPSSPPPVAIESPAPVNVPVNVGAMPAPAPDVNRGNDPFVSLDETRRKLQEQNGLRPTPTAPSLASNAPLPLPKPLSGSANSRSVAAPVVVSSEILKGSKGNDSNDAPLPPIEAGPPSESTATNGTGSGSGFGSGERVAVTPPSEVPGPPKTNGYMRITVNQPTTTTPIVAAPPQPNKSADLESDPMQKARALQGLGRYTDAIIAYRDAITAGASVGEAQQGIGLCYQRAGDIANARVAYIQAIAAFRAQIQAGRNRGAAQRGLNTCEAALGVLSGG